MNQLKLEDDQMCFVCGKNNPSGLKLKFLLHKDNTLTTEFLPEKQHQGFKNVVHGGIISLILDEVMANLNWRLGKATVTAHLEIRLKSPAKIGERLLFKGSIEREDKKILYNQAEVTTENSKVIAWAKAKCLKMPNKT